MIIILIIAARVCTVQVHWQGKGWGYTTSHACIFPNLKISNIFHMQIGERGLNRPPPSLRRISSFPRKMNLEKVSSKMFLPVPSVPFDLNPDKESLAKPSNFCQKPRGFKQTAETARRLLCKLKLPINFQPTHSLNHVAGEASPSPVVKLSNREHMTLDGFSNHCLLHQTHVTELLS